MSALKARLKELEGNKDSKQKCLICMVSGVVSLRLVTVSSLVHIIDKYLLCKISVVFINL